MGTVAGLTAGRIEGRPLDDGVLAFFGVPYARPPVGALRFAPPRAPQPWSGVRAATERAPVAPQTQTLVFRTGPQSEDCLWLNVWTPGLEPDARRPVMVYFHGGASSHDANAATYDGRALARHGDVVVCVVSWRLGALGLLRAPGMDAVNLSLRDQCAALRFLRREAASFGGDPDNLTVFGESRGGSVIGELLVSPLARGLFDRAIAQSPGPWFPHNAPASVERTKTALFADALELPGADALTADVLRALPVERILAAQRRVEALPSMATTDLLRMGAQRLRYALAPWLGPSPALTTPFQLHQCWRHATTDGVTLTEERPVGSGPPAEVPLLCGAAQLEWTLFEQALGFAAPHDRDDVIAFAARFVAPGRGVVDARHDAAATLYDAYAQRLETPERIYTELASDLLFAGAAHQLAGAHARAHPGSTFVYQLRYPTLRRGPCHMVDVPLVFGTPDAMARAGTPLPDDAPAMADVVMEIWASFARGGDPSTGATGTWAPYLDRDGARAVMGIDRRCALLDADDEVFPDRGVHERIFAELGRPRMFVDLPDDEIWRAT